MMQEVCQHFSSSSLAIGRGTYALPASKRCAVEASHDPLDALQLFFSVSVRELVDSSPPHPEHGVNTAGSEISLVSLCSP